MASEAAQDSRKRVLEALERRFAVAKAELLQQQKTSKKGSQHEDEKLPNPTNPSLTGSTVHSSSASDTPASNSSRKGNITFSGYATLQDVEEGGPTYMLLSQSIDEKLMAAKMELSTERGSSVANILHGLLENGDSAQKYMRGSRSTKIDSWILLDNYAQGHPISSGSRIRVLRAHSKRSKKHMSMKQHKKHGSLDLPQELHRFSIFKPMHEMWKGYIVQLLKNVGRDQVAQSILNADLNGAFIIVVECKITHFTGVSGIMIRETAETFSIITEDDKLKVVPKKSSIFVFQVNSWKITLRGDKLSSRNLGL